eukprot:GHVO01042291.1.p1 GENE.GHVO01042291.1~~GHVO01042291.1.p1  ORF type:complete len:168 (-),score=6.51 GHVO01042291.1:85-588(-)
MAQRFLMMNKPTRIEHGKLKFLILDAPTHENLDLYVKEMHSFGVTDLVRTCELTYDPSAVEARNISMHNMVFPDGEEPPEEVISEWLRLVSEVSSRRGGIAIHCVAGLGRAPVLVVIALIERGMENLDAIMYVRERRKGAINRRQLQYLKGYRRRSKSSCGRCCVIM